MNSPRQEPTVPGNQAQSSAAETQLPQPGEGLAASMPQAILGTGTYPA
jgi:hypothetical protein